MRLFFIILTAMLAVYMVVKFIMEQKQCNHAVKKTKPDVAPQKSAEELLKDAEAIQQQMEAMIQADETERPDIRQQILDGTYQGPLPERRNDGGWTSIFDDLRILSIAGINHRDGINRYIGRNTIALVPEPTNEFDVNAIKVVAEDGHHLGYVHRNQTEMVRSWARGEFPMYCTCRIEEREDETDGYRFYIGFLYVKLKK